MHKPHDPHTQRLTRDDDHHDTRRPRNARPPTTPTSGSGELGLTPSLDRVGTYSFPSLCRLRRRVCYP